MLMEELMFVGPEPEYAGELASYRAEMLEASSSMDGCGRLRATDDMEKYLEDCRRGASWETVEPGKVPANQYLCIRKSDGKLLGMLQIRHCLNDYLEKFAGHIGYSVRPSERRKGYAKWMLSRALPICHDVFGLDRVLVTCHVENEGSRRTILANGGVYENTVHEPDRNRDLERYWIDCTKGCM